MQAGTEEWLRRGPNKRMITTEEEIDDNITLR